MRRPQIVIQKQDIENIDDIALGVALHRAMWFWAKDRFAAEMLGGAIEAAVREMPLGARGAERGRIGAIMERFCQSDAYGRFLSLISDGILYPEKEILAADGRLVRVDLLVLNDGKGFICDYKLTGRGREGHIAQVQGYVKALSGIVNEGYILYLADLKEGLVRVQ